MKPKNFWVEKWREWINLRLLAKPVVLKYSRFTDSTKLNASPKRGLNACL
jgi:hypothetical protein